MQRQAPSRRLAAGRRALARAGALAGVAALAGACTTGASEGPARERPRRLSLYCSVPIEWCELVKQRFEAASGIRVAMIRKSSGEAYAQVWAERRSPKADVWFGGTGDAHLQAVESGLAEPYRSPLVDELAPWAVDPAGRGDHPTTGVYMGVLGIVVNHEWLARRDLPVPATWRELARPVYRGEIQMANPASSGTAYTFLATIVALLGDDAAFGYLRDVDANVNQYTKSGAAPTSAVARGETGIAIAFLHDGVMQRRAGFPVEVVAPAEGAGYEIGCVTILRGARHLASAQRFVDWALSAPAQELGVLAGAYQIPSNRFAAIPPEAPDPETTRLAPLDYRRVGSKVERDRILDRWAREVRGGQAGGAP